MNRFQGYGGSKTGALDRFSFLPPVKSCLCSQHSRSQARPASLANCLQPFYFIFCGNKLGNIGKSGGSATSQARQLQSTASSEEEGDSWHQPATKISTIIKVRYLSHSIIAVLQTLWRRRGRLFVWTCPVHWWAFVMLKKNHSDQITVC